MLTINIHNNNVEISSGIKVLLHGEKPMINLDNIVPTYSLYLDKLPSLVGNYFLSSNEVTITYSPNLINSIVHIVDADNEVIVTDKYETTTLHSLHAIYLKLALAHKTTPTLILVEDHV